MNSILSVPLGFERENKLYEIGFWKPEAHTDGRRRAKLNNCFIQNCRLNYFAPKNIDGPEALTNRYHQNSCYRTVRWFSIVLTKASWAKRTPEEPG